jgi:hypothetical protein
LAVEFVSRLLRLILRANDFDAQQLQEEVVSE